MEQKKVPVKKTVAVKKSKRRESKLNHVRYKSTLMIFIALILFVYAAFISIVPSMITNAFNTEDFEKKFEEATSLRTSIDAVEYKITPTLHAIIRVRNLSLKYVDYQPLLDVRQAELKTNLPAIFGSKYKIESLNVKGIKYSDQILPSGENKIAFLPKAFDSTLFGKKSITIVPGPVTIRDYQTDYITPTTFRQKKVDEEIYTKDEVSDFLRSFQYSHVVINGK